nr:MAG TPA: DNA packaging protein gp3 [Caudoviricetes sp.]
MPKVKKVKLYIAPDKNHGKVWIDAEDMAERFEEYLQSDMCLGHTKSKAVIDPETKTCETIDVPAPRSPTIKGFCLFCGTSSPTWYQNYADDPEFSEIVRKITEYCESEVRGMFEDGAISPSLAALWMGGYGYSTKQEQDIKGGVPVVIAGEDKLDG